MVTASGETTATSSLAQRQLEAEQLLGQAFGAPQKGNLVADSRAPTPDALSTSDSYANLRALRRSHSHPSVRPSESKPGAETPSSLRAKSPMRSPRPSMSGVLELPSDSIAASRRTSMANPRLSIEPSSQVPTLEEDPPRLSTGAFSSRPSTAMAGGRPSMSNAPLARPFRIEKSNHSNESFSKEKGSQRNTGKWTFIEEDPVELPEGQQLGRVWSEPTAGPMIRHHEEARIPTFAREPPQDMAEAMTRAIKILEEKGKGGVKASKGRGGRFWLTFFAVFVTAFLSAVDLTIISPILPTIAEELPRGDTTVSPAWITSAFLATAASFQPLFGGLSDAIGRREALLTAIMIFLVGSIVACLAQDLLTVVAGRGVQGMGGGGMLVVGEVIISDMTTLAERGYFLGLLSIAFAVAALAAPIAGGWFATFDWRVAFYINFPIGAIAILMLLPTKLNKPKLSLKEKFERMDLVGSLVLFGAIVSLLIGLTNGGVSAPWSSAEIATPLGLGAAGLVLFFVLEFVPNPLCSYPILPAKLFRHRTAAISYALTFLHGVILYGATQGLVVYFENRGASPLKAAVNILPANAPSTPAAFIAGVIMAVTGKYKGQIIVSEILMTLGIGLFIYLDLTSSTAEWAIFQVIGSFGLGALYSLTLPPIQATLPASELAHATATFAFSRSFGAVWGVSAFLIAFQVESGQRLTNIPGATEAGINGSTAINYVPIISTIPVELRAPVSQAFQDAIRIGFIALVPFAGLGLVLSFLIKHVPLPDFNDSQYGVEGQQQQRAKQLDEPADVEKEATVAAPAEKQVKKGKLPWPKSDTERWQEQPAMEMQEAGSASLRTPSLAPIAAAGADFGTIRTGSTSQQSAMGSFGAPSRHSVSFTDGPFNGVPPIPIVPASPPPPGWLDRLSLDIDRIGPSAGDPVQRRAAKLEKQRRSLEHRRSVLQKKSLELDSQLETLYDEVRRNTGDEFEEGPSTHQQGSDSYVGTFSSRAGTPSNPLDQSSSSGR